MYILRWPEGDIAAASYTMRFEESVENDAQELVDFLATNPPANPAGFVGNWVVTRCTNSQMRTALRQMQLFTIVDNYVKGGNDPYMLDRWEYANEFYYIHPLVDAVVTALSLDKRALFQLASTL